MGDSKKSKDTSNTVLDGIAARLAALTPDQYTAPRRKVGQDTTTVGVLTDHHRRLGTLILQLAAEGSAQERRVERLERQIEQATSDGRTTLERLSNLLSGGLSAETVENCKKQKNELRRLHDLHNLVNALFWLEVRTHFDDLLDRPTLIIYDDWSVGWENDESDGGFEIVVVGGGSFEGIGLPPGLEAMLRGARVEA